MNLGNSVFICDGDGNENRKCQIELDYYNYNSVYA